MITPLCCHVIFYTLLVYQRLIVEFALEDSRALKLREQRKKRQVDRLNQCVFVHGTSGDYALLLQLASKKSPSGGKKSEPKHEEDEEKKSKLLAKKEKWKLKRKAKRLRQKESQSNQDHHTTKSLPTKVSPQSSEALLRTAKRLLAPDAVANSTIKMEHELTLPTLGAKRKASHQDSSGLAVEKRPRVFQVSGNQQLFTQKKTWSFSESSVSRNEPMQRSNNCKRTK